MQMYSAFMRAEDAEDDKPSELKIAVSSDMSIIDKARLLIMQSKTTKEMEDWLRSGIRYSSLLFVGSNMIKWKDSRLASMLLAIPVT